MKIIQLALVMICGSAFGLCDPDVVYVSDGNSGYINTIDNTNYKLYDYGKSDCPKSREISEQLISLPLHLGMDEEKVERVCKTIFSFFKRSLLQALSS